MSIKHTNRDKFLGKLSPADVPLEALPVVELTENELQRVDELAQQRNESYHSIDGGVILNALHSPASSLSRHVIGLLGECAVAKFYKLSVDDNVYEFGDDGFDLRLFDKKVDVKSTATCAMDLPELLVRADKNINSDLYVRAHVIDWNRQGATVRIIGAASRETVMNREPEEHPGSRKNYVVRPHELDLLPALQT